MFHDHERYQRARRVNQLSKIIDQELYDQMRVQSGCTYIRMDECGVAVAETNIVITQLARRIVDYFDEVYSTRS